MVDQVVVLTNGEISDLGSYEELMSRDGAFAQFLKTFLLQEADSDEESEDEESEKALTLVLWPLWATWQCASAFRGLFEKN